MSPFPRSTFQTTIQSRSGILFSRSGLAQIVLIAVPVTTSIPEHPASEYSHAPERSERHGTILLLNVPSVGVRLQRMHCV